MVTQMLHDGRQAPTDRKTLMALTAGGAMRA